MLACILGRNTEIFFPKLEESQMKTFSSICDDFLHSLGYKIKYCSSEEEAKLFAAQMSEDSKVYPVYYFKSDTTGEKDYEEFFVQGEQLNLTKFKSLGVIENVKVQSIEETDKLFNKLNIIFSKTDFNKNEIVYIIKKFLPNFEHKEKGKNLDQKM
jgi:hypothetical protein